MAHEPTPAIVRDFGEADHIGNDGEHPKLIGTNYDAVNFVRGLGNSGYKVQVVEHDCPNCGFDRMVRRWDVNPEHPDEVRYWCLYPNCPYYLSDKFRFAFEGRKSRGRGPVVFESGPV